MFQQQQTQKKRKKFKVHFLWLVQALLLQPKALMVLLVAVCTS